MNIRIQPNIDSVYNASLVPYTTNLYVVGPFATRVSFASQQRRALNLIWAINANYIRSGCRDGLRGKEICVVGAGLSGLTCATAIACFGGSAWIYEQQSEMLLSMLDAKHRELHPTINFWPQEPVEPTTFFPFFNWYQDSCDRVLGRIKREWDFYSSQFSHLRGPTYNCKIDKFEQTQKARWVVSSIHSELPKSEFDALILATGFGPEKFAPNSNTPSYWNYSADCIRRIERSEENICMSCVVSGTGDGGVIEVLRLLFLSFRAGGIELTTSQLLSDPRLPDEIMQIESEVKAKVTNSIIHESLPLEDEVKDEISLFLWNRYKTLFGMGIIDQMFNSKMDKARSCVKKVVLIGERASPLEYTVSPYHKFFLMYAIHRGWVEYFQLNGGVDVRDSPQPTNSTASAVELGILPKNVTFCARRHARLGNMSRLQNTIAKTKNQAFEGCFYIGRHGYQSPIDTFFSNDGGRLATQIRKRQALYADQDTLTMEQIEFFAEQLELARPSDKAGWAKAHLLMAQEFFAERHGVSVKEFSECVEYSPSDRPTDKVKEIVDVKYVLLAEGANYDQEKLNSSRSIIPNRFIGVEIVRSRIRAVPAQYSPEGHS